LQPDDLLRRPDYLAAVKNVEGATQRYRAANKNFYPSLDAYFNYGFDYLTDNPVTSSTANSIIVPGTQETWTAKISLSIPIWDQGVILSRSQTALLNKKKAEIEKENIERTAQTQYDSLQTLFESSLESTANRIQTFSEAEQLLTASKRRFQNGIMSVNDLILDNRQLYDTKLLLIQGWFDVHSNFVDLCHAKNLGLADCISLLR
jgi:outer membrane protein TolC